MAYRISIIHQWTASTSLNDGFLVESEYSPGVRNQYFITFVECDGSCGADKYPAAKQFLDPFYLHGNRSKGLALPTNVILLVGFRSDLLPLVIVG